MFKINDTSHKSFHSFFVGTSHDPGKELQKIVSKLLIFIKFWKFTIIVQLLQFAKNTDRLRNIQMFLFKLIIFHWILFELLEVKDTKSKNKKSFDSNCCWILEQLQWIFSPCLVILHYLTLYLLQVVVNPLLQRPRLFWIKRFSHRYPENYENYALFRPGRACTLWIIVLLVGKTGWPKWS